MINNLTDLKKAIIELENKEVIQKQVLVDQFQVVCETLKPINLLKNLWHQIVTTPGLTNDVINATVGVGAGILSKKLVIGGSSNFFKRILGKAVEGIVTNTVTKNFDKIKNVITSFQKK